MSTSTMSPRRAAARRALLTLTLALFIAGRIWAAMGRPTPPPPDSYSPRWPPAPACIMDATPAGRHVEVFPSGTTMAVALRRLGLCPDPSVVDGALPRASVLARSGDGWSVSPMTQSERWTWGIPMELTLCRADDFERLPGIGPALARRLDEFASNNKQIESVEDLLAVQGIGHGRIQAIAPFLEVEIH